MLVTVDTLTAHIALRNPSTRSHAFYLETPASRMPLCCLSFLSKLFASLEIHTMASGLVHTCYCAIGRATWNAGLCEAQGRVDGHHVGDVHLMWHSVVP